MSRKTILIIILLLTLFTLYSLFFTLKAEAQVIIKIQVVNPLDSATTTNIKSYLPKGMNPRDIITSNMSYSQKDIDDERTDNFDIKLDKEKGQYYVEKLVLLKPKEVVILEIEVKDVWVISQEKINRKIKEINRLTSRSHSKMRKQTIDSFKEEMLKDLDNIVKRQAEDTVDRVGAQRHVEAYQKNLKTFEQVEEDIEVLKNLINQEKED